MAEDWTIETALSISGDAVAVDFGDQNELLAVGDDDGFARLFVQDEWDEVETFDNGSVDVQGVALSPGNQYLAYGTDDDELIVRENNGGAWDVVFETVLDDVVLSVAFSENDAWLSVGADSFGYIFETGTWDELFFEEYGEDINATAFSHDAEFVAFAEDSGTGSDTDIHIYEAAPDEDWPLAERIGSDTNNAKHSVGWAGPVETDDGTIPERIAFGERDETGPNAYIHTVGDGWEREHGSSVIEFRPTRIAYSHSGEWVAMASGAFGDRITFGVIETTSGDFETLVAETREQEGYALSFSADDAWLAIGSEDSIEIRETPAAAVTGAGTIEGSGTFTATPQRTRRASGTVEGTNTLTATPSVTQPGKLVWDDPQDWVDKQASERVVHHDIGAVTSDRVQLGTGQDLIDDVDAVAYYPLDDDGDLDGSGAIENAGSAADAEGNGDLIGGEPGILGGTSVEFDGQSAYTLNESVARNYNREAVTFAAWVYAWPEDMADSSGGIMANYRQGEDAREFRMAQTNDSGDVARVNTWLFEDPADFDSRISIETVDFPFYEWHHVATTFDGGDVARTYLDGRLNEEAAVDFAALPDTELERFLVGLRDMDFDRYFAGRLSDVAVFNQALSPSQVELLYRTGFDGELTTGKRRPES